MRRICTGALLALAVCCEAAVPALAQEKEPLVKGLQDNSFLIEEAYNQERGVVQHIVNGLWERRSKDWILVLTQEWPVPDETHQLSFTVPLRFAGEPDASSGVADVLLNYRWQAMRERDDRPALAPRLSLVLPTGSSRDELGTGSAGVEMALPASKQLGAHFAAHLNAIARIVPHALVPGGSELLTSAGGGGSVIWEPFDAVNVLCELVAVHQEDIEGGRRVTGTPVVLDPGVRLGWDGPGGVQWVWGIGFPIGLTSDADDFGVFLYFSAEHAFTKQAQASR